MRNISQDLFFRIHFLRYELEYEVKLICILLGIRKTLVYQALANFRHCGVPFNPYTRKRTSRPRILTHIDEAYKYTQPPPPPIYTLS